MAFIFDEVPDSPETTDETVVKRYVAEGAENESFIRGTALTLTAPVIATVHGTLFRQEVAIEHVGFNVWNVTVPYGKDKNQTGDYQVSFDTTGGTQHITNSKETVDSYPAGAPDHGNLIGVRGDQVDGVDIVLPALKFTVQFKHPLGLITVAKIKQLAQLTGKVNSTPFFGFAAGEVLFLGCTGLAGSDAETEITYQFAMSQNATNLSIGSITGIDKAGHDYSWISYKKTEDSNKLVQQPEYVYVERVYDRADFAGILGFG